MTRLCIGTSGWSYDHWIGPVYPEGAEPAGLLALYAGHLGAVEINGTFYGLPERDTVAAWADAVPEKFVFAVKASRYITHMKKLSDPADSVARFFEAVEPLGEKLGPVLFQLPPNWHADPERLDAFLAALPAGRHVFEFRNETWFSDQVREALACHGAASCLHDLGGTLSPEMDTGGLVYLRLHGPDGAYRGSYDDAALGGWAERIRGWRGEGREVHVYFDNDETGYAAENAARLAGLVAGREPDLPPWRG
jgi:uncharacterized protein YecE (DUF72 family)